VAKGSKNTPGVLTFDEVNPMEELTLGSIFFRGAIVAILIAANAFFVAAEFALVAARRTRIDEMVKEGDRRARTVQSAQEDLNRLLSACQLGITLASILLGYVAEETVSVLLHDWVAGLPAALSFLGRAAVVSIVAIGTISFLHVVVGELAPKAWAITYPESTSRWIAAPLMFFTWVTAPATNFLNWCANQLVRLLGVDAPATGLEAIHSPGEIMMIVKHSKESGQLEDEDVRLIEGVFEFTEKNARDVMTPRTEVIGLHVDLSIQDAADQVAESGRSRYPIYGESLDDILGIVHAKEILGALRERGSDSVSTLMRQPIFLPGTREVEDVLTDMQRLKAQMAIVLDEFGGTAGVVTMEDMIEEIVGEIYDEYDEVDPLPVAAKDGATVPGDTEIEALNKQLDLSIEGGDHQTIGGLVFGALGRLPQAGDRVQRGSVVLEVLEMDKLRVETVKLVVLEEKPSDS
jgi:CBS domain containing-hemolysin-like protein